MSTRTDWHGPLLIVAAAFAICGPETYWLARRAFGPAPAHADPAPDGVYVRVPALYLGEATPRFPSLRTELDGCVYTEVPTPANDQVLIRVHHEVLALPTRTYLVTPNAAGSLRLVLDYGSYRWDYFDIYGNPQSETFALPLIVAADAADWQALDFNGNGFVEGTDYEAFYDAYRAGSTRADYDRDGFVSGVDFDTFTQDFISGGAR